MRFATGIAAAVGSSLKFKLILFIVTILGVTIGIAPWSAIKKQERQLLLASQEHLSALQELLKTVVVASMLAGDRDNIQRVIEAVSSHADVKGVRIYDTDGVTHFSSRRDERGQRLSPEEQSRYHGLADPVILSRDGDTVTHTLLQPMFNQPPCFGCHSAEQKVLGIMQIDLSLDQTWRQLADLKRSAVLATLLTLGVIVVGIWWSLTLLIDQPLQRLVAVMARAERGELSVRAAARNNDELGRLARHFNQMISKLDAAQQELERYHQEQLARADRLKTIGEMAAAIAHEIRNPLTGISGALSVLSRDFPGNDPRRDIVRETHLLIERLNKSVSEILHYSRPLRPQFQPVTLDEIIERTLSLVEGEAKKARVRLVKEAAGNGASPTVNADPQQIQQVLMNLILNAIQASAAGGQIRISTRDANTHGEHSYACIEIEDCGKGMTSEEAAKAFQPFFSTKPQGTGLGLSIAKQIVEQHEGRISLRSAPGQGTCVQVELPADVDPLSQGA